MSVRRATLARAFRRGRRVHAGLPHGAGASGAAGGRGSGRFTRREPGGAPSERRPSRLAGALRTAAAPVTSQGAGTLGEANGAIGRVAEATRWQKKRQHSSQPRLPAPRRVSRRPRTSGGRRVNRLAADARRGHERHLLHRDVVERLRHFDAATSCSRRCNRPGAAGAGALPQRHAPRSRGAPPA